MSTQLQYTLTKPTPTIPKCIKCNKPTTFSITRLSNRKGNGGRPYYKCIPCKKFSCFADDRGNDRSNPQCHCGLKSRRQVSGPEKRGPRQVHYVCRVGGCDYYEVHLTPEKKPISFNALEVVELLGGLKIV